MIAQPLDNPYGVIDDADRIHKPVMDVPLWTENVLFWASMPNGVAVYTHFGRFHPDPRVWEGITAIIEPGQPHLVVRTFGYGDEICNGGSITATCLVPNRSWKFSFDGVAQRVPREILATREPYDDPWEPLKFELVFDAVHPVWSLGKQAETQDWGHFHIEQGGNVSGFVKTTAKHYDYLGTGFRDRSIGTRDLGQLGRSAWANCVFPSGRVFMINQIWTRSGMQAVQRGFVYRNGRMEEGVPHDTFDMRSLTAEPRDVQIVMDVGGREERAAVETLDWLNITYVVPMGFRFGQRSRADDYVDVTSPARFVWDGETGYGWLQRGVLRSTMDRLASASL